MKQLLKIMISFKTSSEHLTKYYYILLMTAKKLETLLQMFAATSTKHTPLRLQLFRNDARAPLRNSMKRLFFNRGILGDDRLFTFDTKSQLSAQIPKLHRPKRPLDVCPR